MLEHTVYIEREPRYAGWSISIYVLDEKSGVYADSMNTVKKEPGVHIAPLFQVSEKTAQEMMDQLWSCGIRPTEGSGSAGSLAATQYHLEDMRRLVFNETKIIQNT